jgi:ATP-dependent helicase/nuclease subunit B
MSNPLLPWPDQERALRLVCSPAAHTRLAVVAAALRQPDAGDQLVVAPSRGQADDVAREALREMDAVCGVHRAGAMELVVRLATPRLAAEGVTPLSALGFEAVVARVLDDLRRSGCLGAFTASAAHPGFLRAMSSTLQELRMAGLAAADVDDGSPRRHVLARCLASVDETLVLLRQADRARLWQWAADALASPAALGNTPLPVLLVDPVCDARLDLDLWAALVAWAPRTLIAGPAHDEGLQRLATRLGCDLEHLEPAGQGGALARVQRLLFTPSGDEAAQQPDDASVQLFSAPGEGRECVEVARRLLAHARAGVPFDRMAVVLRAPHLYAGHLETALRRAEIPAAFARGTRRPDPAGRALLALIACAKEGMAASRFAEYLSLGQVPRDPLAASPVLSWQEPADAALQVTRADPPAAPSGAANPSALPGGEGRPPRRSPWRWERILTDAAVIGGQDRWRRRLEGFREDLLTRRDMLAAEEPGSPRVEAYGRRAALVSELIDFACPLVERLGAWGDRTSWGVWLDRLARLATDALAAPEHVLAALSDLRPLADAGYVSIDDVHAVLHDRLGHVTIPPPDHRYGAVFVGTPEDLRGRSFRVVLLPGLSERIFPQRSRQDPLLLDEARPALSPWLVTDDGRVAGERLRLRLAVGAASECLVTSFASFDAAQSRPRVPSFYALDIQRACGGRLPGYEHVLREAQRASGARLAWPAPAEAASAIDQAEHDLSILQRHLRGPDSDVHGRARYLFDLAPAVRRSLLARHRRGRRTWTAADGLVADAGTAATVTALLAPHRLNARAYSASALQRFAVCPYQFYLSTIVRLSPRDEASPLTTLDPLTRGSMVHEMLARLMRAFIERGWTPLTAALVPEALDVADDVVETVAAEYRDRLVPSIERVWLDEVAAVHRDLREWVQRLPEDQRAWRPRFVEMGFGFGRGDGRDRASRPDDVVLPGGWRLHGIVDLIEAGDGDTWRVTDYKTGQDRLPDRVVVNRGETLQPALYALAVEQALGGTVTSSRLWYCTTDGGFAERAAPVDPAGSPVARTAALEVAGAIDRSVASGFLPAAPRDEACRWCDFAPICGPHAQAVPRRKERAALDELRAIRSQR